MSGWLFLDALGQASGVDDGEVVQCDFPIHPTSMKYVLMRERLTTLEEPSLAVVTWIEQACHRYQLQRALGKLTPIEFKTI